jgi:hypothetical protein
MQIIIGFVLGFFVATSGFIGVATWLDNAINTAKTVSIKVDEVKK